jgi:hypothetical protein
MEEGRESGGAGGGGTFAKGTKEPCRICRPTSSSGGHNLSRPRIPGCGHGRPPTRPAEIDRLLHTGLPICLNSEGLCGGRAIATGLVSRVVFGHTLGRYST